MNRRVALWCFVLLWMLLIVWLSGDPGEVSREKSRLVDVLIDQGGVLIALAAAGLLLSRRRRTG